MNVKIATQKENIFEGDAKEVTLPGEDGEFSVMDFHQPCLYRLRSGRIKVKGRKEEADKVFPIKMGLAKMEANKLEILVET